MSEWKEVLLGDLCTRVTVGHVGKMADQYVDDGIPFLRSQNVRPFEIFEESLLAISSDFHRRLAKSTLRAGDVVVVRTGYPGTAAVIPPDLDNSNCADLVVITPGDDLNPHVLAAIFNSEWGRSAVSGHLVGSAQQHFNVGSARNLRVRLPDRSTQDRLGAILCALNDSLHNNRRRIRLLEQMAEAVYREWFIRLRYPGHEGATFVDSPLGSIPEDWEAANLFDVADVAFGFSFKSDRFSESGPCPVVRIRDVPTGTTVTFTDEQPPDRYRVVDGDVLIGMDGDFHLRQWTGGTAWLNQRVARLRPHNGLSARYLMLAVADPIRKWNEAITGTTVAHLGKRHLEQIHVLLPSNRALIRATEVFNEIARQELHLVQALRQMAAIRDLLLPQLVTGGIDVSRLEVDEMVESTA